MIIPIKPVPSQTLNIVLAGQQCQIAVYTLRTGLYFDLTVADTPVVTCVICRDAVNLVNKPASGFVGLLAFIDITGASDPTYDGLGVRYFLTYE